MLPKVEERPRLKLGKCPRPRDYLFSFEGKDSVVPSPDKYLHITEGVTKAMIVIKYI